MARKPTKGEAAAGGEDPPAAAPTTDPPAADTPAPAEISPASPPAADPPAAAPEARSSRDVTVEVVSPVHHDGEAYAIGEALSCTAAQADALIAAGAARPLG